MDNFLVSRHCAHHIMGRRICAHAVRPCHTFKDPSYLITGHESFCRPRSMEGGDLRWFWSGFDMIERIDKVGAFLSNTAELAHRFSGL